MLRLPSPDIAMTRSILLDPRYRPFFGENATAANLRWRFYHEGNTHDPSLSAAPLSPNIYACESPVDTIMQITAEASDLSHERRFRFPTS